MRAQKAKRVELRKSQTRQGGDIPELVPEWEAPTGRSIIVAIGINKYQHHAPLDNPINDAQAVLEVFKQCGFQELPGVPSLLANDATRTAIAALPEQLATELTPDDSLVLFFAGHGEKKEKEAPSPTQPGKTYTHRTGYLIPVDSPGDKPGEWIKLDAFLDEINALPARHIFVILDACKSGIALSDKFKVKGGEQPTAVAALRARPSRRVLTSALHDEKAAEGGKGAGHSVFAEALIAAIRDRQADKDGDGFIKTVDLYSWVHDQVSDRALKLFKLKQTPDYGYLPGDGSGDLVISLREGAFNRLIQEALEAMLRHDVPALQALVGQLVAANPDYPLTLYLQSRLRFMQGDIAGARELVSRLRDLKLPAGTLPLSPTDLTALSVQLDYWAPIFALPESSPPVKITLLTGMEHGNLHPAPLVHTPAGDAWAINNGALAQFEVTNQGIAPVWLYFVTVVPTGRLVIGPLLDPKYSDVPGLAPGETSMGRVFLVKGTPGSVTATRIFCSPGMCWDLMSPPSVSMRSVSKFEDPLVSQMQRVTVLYQIHDAASSAPDTVEGIDNAFLEMARADVTGIESAFAEAAPAEDGPDSSDVA